MLDFNIKNKFALQKAKGLVGQIPSQMVGAQQAGIRASARLLQQTAKQYIKSRYSKPPYDTGTMYKQTLVFFPRPLYAEIRPMVDYAIYPHEGLSTSRSYGKRPFLTDAAKDKTEEVEKVFKIEADKILNKTASKITLGL